MKSDCVCSENTAIVFLFGNRSYIENPEHQQLFLGALKSLRNPNFGAWRGSVIIITDQPKFVRQLLITNISNIAFSSDCHDPISVTEDMKSWQNPLGVSIQVEKSKWFHSMGYKVTKTKIPEILEKENCLRLQSNLPFLQYALYVDVDIFSLNPVKGIIDYLAAHYNGEELACFEQPGISGQVLHGGLWLAHIEHSKRFLSEWRLAMDRYSWMRASWDQTALARVVRIRGGIESLSKSILLLPFGDLYPYILDNEAEWRNGIFIHLNRRLIKDSPDQAVHAWFIRELELELFRPIPSPLNSKVFFLPLSKSIETIDNVLHRFHIIKTCSKLLTLIKKFLG